MRINVYLVKRPRDAKAWPVVSEDNKTAFEDKHRVSPVWMLEIREDPTIAADHFDRVNIEAG